MSKKCELTGKSPLKGHKVSHANNKVKRKFLPNLKNVTFKSDILKRNIRRLTLPKGNFSVDFYLMYYAHMLQCICFGIQSQITFYTMKMNGIVVLFDVI